MNWTNEDLQDTAWTDAEALVHGALEQAGDPEPMITTQGGPATVASVYDGLAGFAGPAAQRHYRQRFEVVSPPGDVVPVQLQPGDLLFGRAYGEGGIAWADTITWEDVNEPEPDEPEPMPSRDRRTRRRRRIRIGGRLPHNVMLVRPRRGASEPAGVEAAEAPEWESEFAAPVLDYPGDDTEAITTADIRWIQSALNRLYDLDLAADGRVGRQTREAVSRFQRDRGLSPDGVPGARTIAALRAAVADAGAPQASGKGVASPAGSGAACAGMSSPVVFDRFEFGKDQVLPDHRPLLRQLAECIVESLATPTPMDNMDAVGHTDPVGLERDNIDLGRRRAINIRKALLDEIEAVRTDASQGIVINASSAGETQLRPGPHELSRRVEVFFTPPGARRDPDGAGDAAEDYSTADVQGAQQALNYLYGLNLPENGDLGQSTREALRRFQREKGISPTGEPESATISALRRAIASETTRRSSVAAACAELKSPVVIDKFKFNNDRVLPLQQPSIHGLAECILASKPPIAKISVVGHTDPVGKDAYNVKLGLRRAQNLVAALKRELETLRTGSSKAIAIEFSSKGAKEPRPGAAELSRRVEVFFTRPAKPVDVWPDSPLPASEKGRFERALTKLEALVRASNDPRKWRYECWFKMLKTANVDDRLIRWSVICPATSGAIGAAFIVGSCDLSLGSPVKQEVIEKRIRSIEDVDKVGQSVGIITHLKSDIVVAAEMTSAPLESLRFLHDNVQMAVDKLDKWANNEMGGSSAMPPAYVSIKDWIGRRQRDRNSLYSCH